MHVTDLEPAISLYETVFGLSVAEQLSPGGAHMILLTAGAQRLEFVADSRGKRQTGVVDHLAFAVDNLDVWLLHVREHGAQVIHTPRIEARILFCLGQDNELIELLEQRTKCAESSPRRSLAGGSDG